MKSKKVLTCAKEQDVSRKKRNALRLGNLFHDGNRYFMEAPGVIVQVILDSVGIEIYKNTSAHNSLFGPLYQGVSCRISRCS